MTQIPKQAEYALMALSAMYQARPGELFPARTLCDRYQIPFDVTSRALQRLAKAGILHSVQGKHGGYQIIKDLRGVSLLELLETVNGPVAAADCMSKGCARSDHCPIKGSLHEINDRTRDLFAQLSLDELLAKNL